MAIAASARDRAACAMREARVGGDGEIEIGERRAVGRLVLGQVEQAAPAQEILVGGDLRVPPGAGASVAMRTWSASLTVRAISVWTAKMSLSLRSMLCDQLVKPVLPSVRLVAMRTISLDRWTDPSSR